MATRHAALVEASFTRPADTNAYLANDAIADSTTAPASLPLVFSNVVENDGDSGLITGVRFMTNNKDWTARLRLHLYTSAPNAINDNAKFTVLYANRSIRVASIELPPAKTGADTSDAAFAAKFDEPIEFICGDSKNLWGLVETLDAVASPANAQQFYFGLLILRD